MRSHSVKGRIRNGIAACAAAGLLLSVIAPIDSASGATANVSDSLAGGPVAPDPKSDAAPLPEIADDRVLVGLKAGTSRAAALDVAADAGASVSTLDGQLLIVDPAGSLNAASVGAETVALEDDPRVAYAEPNYRVSAASTPNDLYYGSQYALVGDTTGSINATRAWDVTTGSDLVVVGVLDSGVDIAHTDLVGNLWSNPGGFGPDGATCEAGSKGRDFISDDCTPNDDPGVCDVDNNAATPPVLTWQSHGTHVSGIIGAQGNNAIGITGVSQNVSLMALRMLDGCGQGSVADAILAIDWALGAKADGVNLRVLNASWGGELSPSESLSLQAAIARAEAAGVLIVVAAGNTGKSLESAPSLPCSYPLANIVCVAASTATDTLASSSSYGAQSVDLAAPGVDIWSTVVPSVVRDCPKIPYCAFDGTSMSTAQVTGGASLVLASSPALSLAQLRTRILNAVDPLASMNGKVATRGRFDVCRAIVRCSPVGSSYITAEDAQATLTWTIPSHGAGTEGISGYVVSGSNGYQKWVAAESGVLSDTITGLTNNVNYDFWVSIWYDTGLTDRVTTIVRPHVDGGFVADGWGGLHPFRVGGAGPTISPASSGPYWHNWDIVRGVALLPNGIGGYVLDGLGGLHGFAVGENVNPPAVYGAPYWQNWNIARGAAIFPDGSGGYVVDGFGGIHRFAIGGSALPQASSGSPYWNNWDVVRDITLKGSTGGYIVDLYGGVHRFAIGTNAMPPAATGSPYWNNWDIARGIELIRDSDGGYGGYVLDGWGGMHPFNAGGSKPAAAFGNPYWIGWTIAQGIAG